MPLKVLKNETAAALTLEWVLHVKNYKLVLDRNLCVGCEICSFACPKEAICLVKQPKNSGGKAQKAKVDIAIEKCNFCGICDILCPYGAIKVTVNGNHVLSVVEKESFPQLIREIQVDSSKCPPECVECEEACPLGLIKVTCITPDGKKVDDLNSLGAYERSWVKVNLDIDEDKCPACRICEFKCPEGAIHVRKIFYGKIRINQDKCPEGCRDCVDVCPITGALYVGDDGRVYVNEPYCVYCGACKVVCPAEGALELVRTRVMHTPVKSGAWNKALERISSPLEMSKELKAKGSFRAIDS
ncbi:4Fe-4S binding protein, partial [Candidatus Bathyarchaeota archaeon]|nr:4Fe-4S binding protein [Candidatus Bathyarchaeota archaeon]